MCHLDQAVTGISVAQGSRNIYEVADHRTRAERGDLGTEQVIDVQHRSNRHNNGRTVSR
jgi:hypothetical protein